MIHHKELNICIVDKDLDKANALKDILQEEGVKAIMHSESCYDVAAWYSERSGHLLVVGDTCLEGTTQDCLKILDGNTLTKAIPRLLFTSERSQRKIRALVAEGISGVIHYPLDTADVRASLRNYVRQEATKEICQLVREASFFQGFTNKELNTLSKVAIVRFFTAGETIITKDDPSDRFYVLLKGKIEVIVTKDSGPPLHLEIGAGHSFGEMGLLDSEPRSAFCIAADDSYVLEIGAHIIKDNNYNLRLKILTQIAYILARRVRKMNAMMESATQSAQLTDEEDDSEPPLTQHQRPQPSVASLARERLSADSRERTLVDVGGADTTPNRIPPPKAEKQPDADSTARNDESRHLTVGNEENLFTVPTGVAETFDLRIRTNEEYDVLTRKIQLRSDFVVNKIPKPIWDTVINRMYGYWTGGKLAKINPHRLWNLSSFTRGSPRLLRSMHLVVVCSAGDEAYGECYLQLPFSHRVVGLPQVGCAGTFLGSEDSIKRYFAYHPLAHAVKLDLETPVDRLWNGQDCIEFLTHTALDVRDETLFLVFDTWSGANTRRVREAFPQHQIVTVVLGLGFDPDDPASIFTYPEKVLTEEKALVPRKEYQNEGFYLGQTQFLPDFSHYYENLDALHKWGAIFGTMGIFAKIGPDFSGVVWGSKGGADGAVKAARAMYGIKGAQSALDLANAINWADE